MPDQRPPPTHGEEEAETNEWIKALRRSRPCRPPRGRDGARELELRQRPLWKAEPPGDPMRVLRAGEMAGLGALVRRCADLADLAGDTMSGLAAEAAASAQRVRVLAHRCKNL